MTSPIPGFDISSLPWVKEAKAKADAAAATKAAYDAIPYSQHLADARAAVKTAQAASDAWKPDPSTTPAWMRGNNVAINSLAQLSNPNRQGVTDANAAARQLQIDHLRTQLEDTSKRYGYNWQGNKSADFHAGNVATMLVDQGISDLANVKYDKTGNYLMNSETGNNLSWYKSAKHPNEGPLANQGQLGWSAKGAGRTDYRVQKDASGNPVFYPQWHDESPTGLGGFLLQAAPAIVGFATGQPELAALTSAGIGVASGQGIGDIIKGAAINAAGQGIGNLAANAATGALPMLGNAGLTNAAADALGGAASGATRSLLSGQGLAGTLPGAITAGVTSGVNSLGQSVSGGLQQAGLSPNLSNAATQIGAGGLSNLITSGGNLDAALAGATNSAIGAAGQAVAGNLPDTGSLLANKVASGVANSAVTGGLNDLINGSSSSTAPSLASYIGTVDPRLMQRVVTNPAFPTATPMPPGVVAPTNTTTAFNAPVKSMPTTGMTSVTDPAMLKKLGLG